MPQIGIFEVVILLIVLLLVFGPKRIPEVMRSLGKGAREFKTSVSGEDEHHQSDESSTSTTTMKQELPPASPPPPGASAAQQPTPVVTRSTGSGGTPR
jgi:sec-independent protein translocase protein TatA